MSDHGDQGNPTWSTREGNAAPVIQDVDPAEPTIGPQTQNVPRTMLGGGFSPQMIERFTEIAGDTLEIFSNMSTWNPTAVVVMESDFAVACSGGG